MDELHKTAKAYYRAAPENIKQMAKEFFEAMDVNKDGKITRAEYLAFMKEKKTHAQMKTREFFKKLDKDGTDDLKFWEIMTLYYIINSGRPFCDGCGVFISGQFFTCTECFDKHSSTLNVCTACFIEHRHVHRHNQFLDNFVLLETKRSAALKKRKEEKDKASSSQGIKTTSRSVSRVPDSVSKAIVPVHPERRSINWRVAKQLLVVAGHIAHGFCPIM